MRNTSNRSTIQNSRKLSQILIHLRRIKRICLSSVWSEANGKISESLIFLLLFFILQLTLDLPTQLLQKPKNKKKCFLIIFRTMAYHTLRQEYMLMPPVTRAYTTMCLLTSVTVVSKNNFFYQMMYLSYLITFS